MFLREGTLKIIKTSKPNHETFNPHISRAAAPRVTELKVSRCCGISNISSKASKTTGRDTVQVAGVMLEGSFRTPGNYMKLCPEHIIELLELLFITFVGLTICITHAVIKGISK